MQQTSQHENPHLRSVAASQRSAHNRIFIVGGGPSLKGFDFDILHDSYLMCCNDSFLSLPWADAVVSIDKQWIHNRQSQLEEFQGRKYIGRRDGATLPEITDTVEFVFNGERGLGEWDCIHGATTGHAALNIAVLLGASFIGLLGFDYNPSGHWHAGYAWRSAADVGVWRKWASDFDAVPTALANRNVQIVNFNPASAVTAFPRATLESICDYL